MGDFGRTDEFAPDSTAGSDLSKAKIYTCMDGALISIAPNDWLDLSDMALPPDPMWGYSFQVYDTENDELLYIKVYNSQTDLYEIVALSPIYVSDVFRHVAYEEQEE